MKNITTIILFSVLAFASLNSKAQGDLQFNQVRLEHFESNLLGRYSTYVDTLFVPADKVLKITTARNYYIPNSSSTASQGGFVSFYIAGILVYNNNGTDDDSNVKTPIWLPEGSHTITMRFNGASSTAYLAKGYLSFSGIEFNVVQ